MTWCVTQHCERQHSSDESRAVDKAHEEGGQKRDPRRMDGTPHKPRLNGNELTLALCACQFVLDIFRAIFFYFRKQLFLSHANKVLFYRCL